MKKVLKFATAVAGATAMFAGSAYAVTSITFLPTSLVEVSSFPYVRDVSATFTHTGDDGTDDLCKNANGTTWTLRVVDSGGETLTLADGMTPATATGQYLREGSPWVCPAGGSKTEIIEGVRFPDAGTYTLTGTLKTNQGSGLNVAEDAELVLQLEQDITVTYAAAPSVAARMLAEAGVSARYGSGKSGGNHIADVAAEMNATPGTDFRGVPKRDVGAYAAKVHAFLVENGAIK